MPQPPPPATSPAPSPAAKEPRFLLLCLLLASFFLILFLLLSASSRSPPSPPAPSAAALRIAASDAGPALPRLAYLLSGTSGDGARLLRILRAAYHPRNLYLLHLDRAAYAGERVRLAQAARAIGRNAHVVGDPGFANPRGASALAAALHGAAILLRLDTGWDWIINLGAADYPLITQDDLLHVFSFLPRDLNFVQHTSYIGWKESRNVRPIIIDPALYLSSRTDVFYATQKREFPDAYRLFTGSSSLILSRKFTEFCILGTDNLPRTLLMYYTNIASSLTNYFQTVLCNSPEFNLTVTNGNLRYTLPGDRSRPLAWADVANMSSSGMAFASGFSGDDDPVLDLIDKRVLRRPRESVVPGGWCIGVGRGDPCAVSGDPGIIRPGPGAEKLAEALTQMLSAKNFAPQLCIWD